MTCPCSLKRSDMPTRKAGLTAVQKAAVSRAKKAILAARRALAKPAKRKTAKRKTAKRKARRSPAQIAAAKRNLKKARRSR